MPDSYQNYKYFLLILVFCVTTIVSGDDLESLINKAKDTLKSGDAKKSAEMLNHILTGMKKEIRNHPRHAETWYYFSVALDRLGRKELSQKALDRAKKLKQMQSEKKVEASNEAGKESSDQAKPETTQTASKQNSVQSSEEQVENGIAEGKLWSKK